MTTSIYHYVYRITNIIKSKHYYGSRTSTNILPENDLGIVYQSSSQDKEFISEQKEHPENFRYKIINTFKSREEAIDFEIILHNKFDVAKNPKFYNKSKQSSSGFDVTGMVSVMDKCGKTLQVTIDDSRYISGELTGATSNRFVVIDREGNRFMTNKNDPRYISGELVSIHKDNNKGSTNGMFRGYWIYKDEKFTSVDELSAKLNIGTMTVWNWCKKNHVEINRRKYLLSPFLRNLYKLDDIIGLTYKDIGFNFEKSIS